MFKRLFPRLYSTYLLVILLCTGVVGWYAVRSIHAFHASGVADELETKARLIVPQIAPRISAARPGEITGLCRDLGASARIRITVVLPSGEVVGDSEEDPAQMENHFDRPEIRQAFAGQAGRAIHYSRTLKTYMMYVAVPLREKDKTLGVIRTSLALTAVEGVLGAVYRRIAAGAVGVAILAAGIGLFISRRLSRPLKEMRCGAERFAQGEFTHRIPLSGTEETSALAGVLNRMAAQLNEKLQAITQQRNEQEAMLASMIEGVVALDRSERILRLNHAAGELLGVNPAQAEGRRLLEVVRNADLQRFVTKLMVSRETIEDEIVLHNGREQYLQLHGSVLRDATGRDIGALMVLNDVTRIRRLETVRRDFVANVSHELMTPITAIQGFVETLREGAIHDTANAGRFLDIIAEQVDRLNTLLEDLLQLSRLEQGDGRARIDVIETPLRSVLEAAVADCRTKADEQGITVTLACPDDLRAAINSTLIEQAVVNLLDNAIKYSERGSTVRIEAEVHGSRCIIRVCDTGCGIAAEHLPRLFERFYRVDKARSRKLGGTGLGLAIVKHIAQVHGGSVGVESAPGKGSTFSISLPQTGP